MDVQRYISSGIIESYVVGLVSEQEAREVESAIAQYPEVKTAVEACRQDMERYVEMYAIKPPKAIRNRILEAIENETSPEGEALLPEELREPQSEGPAFKMPALKVTKSQLWIYTALLMVALLTISIIFNVIYARDYKEYHDKYTALQAGQETLNTEMLAWQAKVQALEQELSLLKDPGFKWTRLSGTGKHAGQLATVGWNPQSKQVYLLALTLPEPGPDQQYQLWAIINGKPVDAGVFDMSGKQHSLQKMKEVTAVQVFAITLGKKGGSPTPATDQVFVAGRVNG